MKILLDANLSPRLIPVLRGLFPEVQHVQNLNLATASDDVIWAHARDHGFTIATKDSDFVERSILHGSPPKVIWIRIGNCSTRLIADVLSSASETTRNFIETDAETCMVLGHTTLAE